MEQVTRIELASSDWQTEIITVILHLRAPVQIRTGFHSISMNCVDHYHHGSNMLIIACVTVLYSPIIPGNFFVNRLANIVVSPGIEPG